MDPCPRTYTPKSRSGQQHQVPCRTDLRRTSCTCRPRLRGIHAATPGLFPLGPQRRSRCRNTDRIPDLCPRMPVTGPATTATECGRVPLRARHELELEKARAQEHLLEQGAVLDSRGHTSLGSPTRIGHRPWNQGWQKPGRTTRNEDSQPDLGPQTPGEKTATA